MGDATKQNHSAPNQDPLQEARQELQDIVYAVSHDLQEPLRMVSSYMQLLERRYHDELGEDGKEFIDFAVDGAVRMQAMLSDLLIYSRVETHGKDFQQLSLAEILDRVLFKLRDNIEQTDAQIQFDDLPDVVGDRNQITCLFENLISNALIFKSDQPPQISINYHPDLSPPCFSIKDNGIGMAPEQHQRAFNVYQKLNTRAAYPGTGMGLAICKRILKRHGQSIWIESELGQGSTIWFTMDASSENT